MARTINMTVESGQLPGRSSASPEPPNFSVAPTPFINFQPSEAAGSGLLALNQRQMQIGMAELGRLQEGLNRTLFNNAIITATENTVNASEEWIKQNPTGKGYAKYLTNFWTDQIRESSKNAPNREIAEMINFHGEVTLKNMIVSSIDKEKELITDYQLGMYEENTHTLLGQVLKIPENFPSLELQYNQQIEAMKEILMPRKFAHLKIKALDDLGKTYGIALVEKNPYAALNVIQNGGIKNISVATTTFLTSHARHAITAQEALHQRQDKLKQHTEAMTSFLKELELSNRTEIGSAALPDYDVAEISSGQKQNLQQLYGEINERSTKFLSTQAEILSKVRQSTPLLGYSNDEVNFAYRQMVNHQKGKNPDAEFTTFDKTTLALRMETDEQINDLTQDIRHDLEHSKNPQEVHQAARSVQLALSNNPKILGGENFAKKYEAFASFVTSQATYEGTQNKNLADIVKVGREMFFSTDSLKIKEMGEHNFRAWRRQNNDVYTKIIEGEVTRDGVLKRFFGRGTIVPETMKAELLIDTQRELHNAFLAGADDETAVKTTQAWLKRNYHPTRLNASKDSNPVLMKGAPELLYPSLKNKPFFRNTMFGVAQEIIRENMKAFGENSLVKLEENIIDAPKDGSDLVNNTLTHGKVCEAMVKIGDKYEKRQLWLEKDEYSENKYALYWLHNQNNLFTRRYLKYSNDFVKSSFSFIPPKVPKETP
jgi:hypothetical protein